MTAISNNTIARAIHLASKEEKNAKNFSANVIAFLVKRKLLSKAHDILFHLGKIVDLEEGIVRAKVASPEKLDARAREALTHFLKERYAAKRVVLEETTDSKLLGSFKIEVGDEIIDLSAKKRLEQLQEHLTQGARK